MLKKIFLCFAIIWICPAHVNQSNCLFKNPLCFYNTDILTYLQVLHKNQQYDKMIKNQEKNNAIKTLSNEKIIDSVKQQRLNTY